MEALLQIRIRVSAREAMSEVRAVENQLRQLDQTAVKSAATGGGLGGFFGMIERRTADLVKFGKNLQWTGRQLEFSFTLPLLLAGGMATKWALDNEAAMTRVRKVYGDGTESADQLQAELDALSKSFELLSSRFGVNREEVIQTAEAWAQAGSAGVGLAKNVRNTLEFSIVSGLDLTKSTEALIATQAIFGYTSEEMAQQLAFLNQIENQTAIDMGGLIDVLQRAGGAARGTGIDIRHLAAFAAALVPAAGGAAKAGNSLRTIISRIFAPTKQAREAMAALGIDVDSTSWLMKNGAERIELLAQKTEGLTANQEALLASVLGSRYQFNQFMVLMNDVANSQGNYAKALAATEDAQAAQRTYAKEITTFLESNPQRFQILITTLQNFLANAILPLLPALISFLQYLTRVAQAFANLDPSTQQFIITMLALLALFGPILRYTGAFATLFGELGKIVIWVTKNAFWPLIQTVQKNLVKAFGSAAASNAKAASSAGAAWLEEASATAAYAEEAAAVQTNMAKTKAMAEQVAAYDAEAAWLGEAAASATAADVGATAQAAGAAGAAGAHVTGAKTASGAWIMGAGKIAASSTELALIEGEAAAASAGAWNAAWGTASAGYELFNIQVASTTAATTSETLALVSGFTTATVAELAAVPVAAGTALATVDAGVAASARTMMATWLGAMDAVAGAALRYGFALERGSLQAVQAATQAAITAEAAWLQAWASMEAAGLGMYSSLTAAQEAFIAALATGNSTLIANAWYAARGVVEAWTVGSTYIGKVWIGTADGMILASSQAAKSIEAMVAGSADSLLALTSGASESVALATTSMADWVTTTVSEVTVFVVDAAGVAARSWVLAAEAIPIAWNAVFSELASAAQGVTVFIGTSAGEIVIAHGQAALGVASEWTAAYTTIALEATGAAAVQALMSGTVPVAAIPASVTTTTTWLTAYTAIAGGAAASSATAAASQFMIPAAALPAATATTSIWGTAFAGLGGALKTMFAPLTMIFKPFILAAKGAVQVVWILFSGLLKLIAAGVVALAGFLGLPIWAVVAIIVAVITALVVTLLYIFNKGFREKVNEIFASVGKFIHDTISKLWNWLQTLPAPFKWLVDGVEWVIKGLAQLPQAIASIFRSVVQIIATAVQKAVDWLSYLNPFARHSPSLVDNVTAGIDEVVRQYTRVNKVSAILRNAAAAHKAFIAATSGQFQAFDTQKRSEQRATVAKQAPQALPAFDQQAQQLTIVKTAMQQMEPVIADQEMVVNGWQKALDAVNKTLDAQESILASLKDQLEAVNQQISDAESEINTLANTDLVGMRAMEDQIFANEMAQKRLRLEMLRMEDAGQGIDDIRDKLAALQADMETLRAERTSLRDAGAGSDVLDAIDAEIAGLEAQKDALQGQAAAADDLQKQLEDLQRQGEILDLEKSIQFDEQLRQIDQMAEGLHELPFDEIVAKIQKEQDSLVGLRVQQDALNAKVAAQTAIVDQTKAKRDEVAAALEREKYILDTLKGAYQDLSDLAQEMESNLNDFVSGLEAAAKKAADGIAEQLAAAGAGDFEIPGGDAIIGREGGLPDIQAFNDELQKELEDALAGMGEIDPFKPIRDAWDRFKNFMSNAWDWFKENWYKVLFYPVWIGYQAFKMLEDRFHIFSTAWNVITTIVKAAWNIFVTAIKWAWDNILKPVFDAIGWVIGNVIVPVFQFLASVISWVWNTIIVPVIQWAWENVIKPIFDAIWGFITGYLVPVFQLLWGVVQIVWELISRWIETSWNLIKGSFEVGFWLIAHLMDLFSWLWDKAQIVWQGIQMAIAVAWAIIKPIWDAIWKFMEQQLGPKFEWLKGVAQISFEKIKDVISWVWDHFLKPIFGWIGDAIGGIGKQLSDMYEHVWKPIWDRMVDVLKTIWNVIASVIGGGVNFFIKAFNNIAKGVKAIGSVLGLDIQINEMKEIELPRFEKGGKLPEVEVGYGFVTSGARAIVGEGKKGYPEYVIPTDPSFRQRATELYNQLGYELGVNKETDNGDYKKVMNEVENIFTTLSDEATSIRNQSDIENIFNNTNSTDVKNLVSYMQSTSSKSNSSMTSRNTNLAKFATGGIIEKAGTVSSTTTTSVSEFERGGVLREVTNNISKMRDSQTSDNSKIHEYVIDGALRETNNISVMTDQVATSEKNNRTNDRSVIREYVIDGALRETNDVVKLAQGGMIPIDAVPQFGIGGWISDRVGDIASAGGQLLKFGAGAAWQPLRAIATGILDTIQVPFVKDIGYSVVHMVDDWVKMSEGGTIVNRTPGGVPMIVGEGLHPERVTVTPLKGDNKDSEGDTTIHFHGDLVFPNVKDGDDAKDFLDNLKVLGKS